MCYRITGSEIHTQTHTPPIGSIVLMIHIYAESTYNYTSATSSETDLCMQVHGCEKKANVQRSSHLYNTEKISRPVITLIAFKFRS